MKYQYLYFRQHSDTGLELELLQEYVFIPLDIYRKSRENKAIETVLEAWLAFLSFTEPKRIDKLQEQIDQDAQEMKQMGQDLKQKDEKLEQAGRELKQKDETLEQTGRELKQKDQEIAALRAQLAALQS